VTPHALGKASVTWYVLRQAHIKDEFVPEYGKMFCRID